MYAQIIKFLIINNVCANNKIFEICKYFLKIILKIIKFIFNKKFFSNYFVD